MYIRADSVLKYLLLELHERAATDELASNIMDVLDHLGDKNPYRGGKQLVALLEFAVKEAAGTTSSEGLSDALGYATGRVLEDDLQDRYPLYSGSGQYDLPLAKVLTESYNLVAVPEIDKYLQGNPTASAKDYRQYLVESTKRAIRFVRARRAGHYGAFRIRTDGIAWMLDVLADRVEFNADNPNLGQRIDAILTLDDAELLISATVLELRRRKLDEIERVVENPYSKEEHLQKALADEPWLFGGGFATKSEVRRLVPGHQVDIALLRPDGVLHVVELKQANVASVKRHRAEPVPTAEVHDAVMQVANYLKAFDENRSRILARHGIDARRASGTVVIGHPMYDVEFDEQIVNETLRSYNSHLSRIDVMTYKQLLDSAGRTLRPESFSS
jgi:Domain of unknown function (DUF4263)